MFLKIKFDLKKINYSDSEFVDDAHLLKSKVFIEKKYWVQAVQEIELLLSKFPELKNSKQIENVFQQIKIGKLEKVNG